MGPRSTLLILGLLTLGVASARPAPPAGEAKKAAADKPAFTEQVVPFLAKHCTACHGGAKPKAGLALDKYKDEAAVLRDRRVWDKVLQNVRAGDMPPPTRKRPAPAEVEGFVAWVEAKCSTADCKLPDPGRVTLRRLNRVEYNNTIHDLVGVRFQPADDFPADDVGYGFDNIGDVLSMPPILMEKYLAAAEKVVAAAFKSPDARKRIMIAEPTDNKSRRESARKIIAEFARRAYRRPVGGDEVNRLVRFVKVAEEGGDNFDKGIQLALEAVLVSPHFLFRVELDGPSGKSDARLLNEFELASRLSYFLWSSMPDEELFAQAGAGTLRKNLDAQVRRMLNDPKAKALVENFAGQWLQLRSVKTATPDPKLFPTFDDKLRTAMLRETELFFQAVMKEDRSVLSFIDADFTFLNERLARHYGIAGIQGEEFRRVTLTGQQRGGVLTQASILTVTSNPTRTSPVKRGKWILENILGTPQPPPPPDAGELSEDKNVVSSGSLRQRMELHRSKAICASCHNRMDPLGFGFENFNAIGAWRTQDGKFPIDPSGTLPGGQSFQGPAELKVILKAKAPEFRRCLTEKMLTYALGRGLESSDKCVQDQIADNLARNQDRFSSLVLAIVKSDPFQKRKGKETASKRGQDP